MKNTNRVYRKRLHKQIYRKRFGGSQPSQQFRWKWKIALYKTLFYKTPNVGLCSEIVGIQPMDDPIGQAFYLNLYEPLRDQN